MNKFLLLITMSFGFNSHLLAHPSNVEHTHGFHDFPVAFGLVVLGLVFLIVYKKLRKN
jgi:hypothetical protein